MIDTLLLCSLMLNNASISEISSLTLTGTIILRSKTSMHTITKARLQHTAIYA